MTGRDRDEEFSVEAPAEVEGKSDLTAAMDEFPRGAEAGTLLHDVLEHIDFSAYDESEVKTLAAQAARHAGFSADHVDQIVHVVESVARTPLRPPPNRFCLADLPRGQQRPEIEFTLSAPGRSSTEHFSPTSLSRLLRETDDDTPLRRYADRLSQMGWRTLNGYLRGFIDAVFFDGRQYFLIDYKSNYLGSRQVDYMPDRLIQPMIDHDYVLQYLIYAIALDRHLAQRLSGYDYDEHFGGVYYLVWRGLAESHEPGCGIFFDRPSRELIGGVSALLSDARRGAK